MEKVVKIGKKWFAGNVNSCNNPQASGPGQWDGEWLATKKQAENHLKERNGYLEIILEPTYK